AGPPKSSSTTTRPTRSSLTIGQATGKKRPKTGGSDCLIGSRRTAWPLLEAEITGTSSRSFRARESSESLTPPLPVVLRGSRRNPSTMNRSLSHEWIRRHKAVTVALAIVAAPVFSFWMFHGTTDSQTRFDAALAARRSAEALLDAKQLAEGERHCRRAVEILTDLAARSSERRIHFEEGTALETLAMIQSAARQPADASASYFDAIDIWSRLLGADQRDVEVRWRLAHCL